MSSLQGHFLFSSKGNLGNDGKKHAIESRVENVKAMSGQQKISNIRLLDFFFFFLTKMVFGIFSFQFMWNEENIKK